MTDIVFTMLISTLCNYYERKEPRRETIDLWFGKIKHVDDRAVETIVSHIQESHDMFPKNLPMLMQSLYRDWAAGHPGYTKKEVMCPDCNGGIITLIKLSATVGCYCKFAFTCARCKQYQAPGYRMAYRAQLMAEGYREVKQQGKAAENINLGKLIRGQGLLKDVPGGSPGSP